MLTENEILKNAVKWCVLYECNQENLSIYYRSRAFIDVLELTYIKRSILREYCNNVYKKLCDRGLNFKSRGFLLDWLEDNVDFTYIEGLIL